jgi:hypothetical protein
MNIWTIGSYGPQPEVVVENADLDDPFIGIPESQEKYIHQLIVLDEKTVDESEIDWAADVPDEARRHAFRYAVHSFTLHISVRIPFTFILLTFLF